MSGGLAVSLGMVSAKVLAAVLAMVLEQFWQWIHYRVILIIVE
jgi:hypothetical protein